MLMMLNLHPDLDPPAILAECRRWDQQHAEPLRELIQPHTNTPQADRRLRVGYVSRDFREHPSSSFVLPLLSHHDHRQVEIFCYANVERADFITERMRAHADVWRNTSGVSDQEVADLVRVQSDRYSRGSGHAHGG